MKNKRNLFLLSIIILAFIFSAAGCNFINDIFDKSENKQTETVELTFILNGGNAITEKTVTKGDSIISLPTPTKIGYSFNGWFYDATFENKFASGDIFDADTTLYAKWQIQSFTLNVTSEENGTISGTGNGTYEYNTLITLTATPNSDYKFDGWYNGSTKVSSSNPYKFNIASNISLIAKFLSISVVPENTIVYDKADNSSLTLNSINNATSLHGSNLTTSDYTINDGTPTINQTYLNSLTAGDYSIWIKGASSTLYTLQITNSNASPYNLQLNYDRDYPNIKIDFDCDCNGEHTVSIDGGVYVTYNDQNFTLSKTTKHTLKVKCSNGNETEDIILAPTCDSSYLSQTYTINGETQDFYVNTVKQLATAYQYLLFTPYTLTTGEYAAKSELTLGYGGEVLSMIENGRGNEMLQSVLDKIVTNYSISIGYSFPDSNLIKIHINYPIEPTSVNSTNMPLKTLSDDRIFFTAGSRNESFENFAINNFTKSQLIHSVAELDELAYGVMPTFDSTESSQKAKLVYDKAKEILRLYINDDMTAYEKVTIIYDYLGSAITYDDYALALAIINSQASAYKTSTDVSLIRSVISNGAIELSSDGTYASSPIYSLVNPCYSLDTSAEIYAKLSQTVKQLRAFSIEGALLDNLAVCDGIASAFKLMCLIEGINAIEVSGYAGENHAWNKVLIDNVWYVCDATWAISGNNVSHKYLLINDDTLLDENRQERNKDGYASIEYFAANDYDYYDNYVVSGSYDLKIDSQAELTALIQKTHNAGKNTIEFYYEVNETTMKNGINTAMTKLGIYGSYSYSINEYVYIVTLP